MRSAFAEWVFGTCYLGGGSRGVTERLLTRLPSTHEYAPDAYARVDIDRMWLAFRDGYERGRASALTTEGNG